ncbi:hypothetical protein J6590_018064 [Homalodisca vitripennis]|nr:hypothetical protein J6590_018064 [Homalodisca vitripennis]
MRRYNNMLRNLHTILGFRDQPNAALLPYHGFMCKFMIPTGPKTTHSIVETTDVGDICHQGVHLHCPLPLNFSQPPRHTDGTRVRHGVTAAVVQRVNGPCTRPPCPCTHINQTLPGFTPPRVPTLITSHGTQVYDLFSSAQVVAPSPENRRLQIEELWC